MTKTGKVETWWDEHPFLRKFYVPMVVTATLVVGIADWLGSR